MQTRFLWENMKERDHLKDLGRVILTFMVKKIGWVDLLCLVEVRNQWQVLQNIGMRLCIP